MPVDLNQLDARLMLIDWREREFCSITAQLEDAFPALQAKIAAAVEGLTRFQLAKAQVKPKDLAAALLVPWADEQAALARARGEFGLESLVENLQTKGQMAAAASALPALAGAGMLAASIFALPTVVTWATVTTTSFFFFSTSALSVPALLIGGTVLAGTSLAGVNVLGSTERRLRRNLAKRIEAACREQVFGTGLDLGARCLLTDLQALALKSSQTLLAKAH